LFIARRNLMSAVAYPVHERKRLGLRDAINNRKPQVRRQAEEMGSHSWTYWSSNILSEEWQKTLC
jgi:hypothetical protein